MNATAVSEAGHLLRFVRAGPHGASRLAVADLAMGEQLGIRQAYRVCSRVRLAGVAAEAAVGMGSGRAAVRTACCGWERLDLPGRRPLPRPRLQVTLAQVSWERAQSPPS